MAIWKDKEIVRVEVGTPFNISVTEPDLAAVEAMSKIAEILPEKLRGPFR